MDLREEFKKEHKIDCYKYSRDHAGAIPYQDGFKNEYVEWLEKIIESESSLNIKPFSPEMWSFLLVNSLRSLTEEQRAGLCFDLYSRNGLKDTIDSKIEELNRKDGI